MNEFFKENGYLVIRNFFSDDDVATMQAYFELLHFKVHNEPGQAGYEKTTAEDFKTTFHVADSYSSYGDLLTETLSLKYGPKLCAATGLNLSPTYTFTRMYEKGNVLLGHTDRPSCEISITAPVLISDARCSTIYVSKFLADDIDTNNKKSDLEGRFTPEEMLQMGEFARIDLLPGDVLVYKGMERYHWRHPLESDLLIQFFMHYVRSDGPYAEYVFDKRPYVGFSGEYRNYN